MIRLRFEGRSAHLNPARLLLFVIAAVLACWLYPTSLVASPTITYVQCNYAAP